MQETSKDPFVEEVKELLSGYITDKDTAIYLAFKIERIRRSYAEKKYEQNYEN